MYRRLVEQKLRKAFAGLNRGDASSVTGPLSPGARHYFIGSHALSGVRGTPESIGRWYGRLLRLLPDIRFDLHRVQVEGPPWRTLVVVEWAETNSGTDGVRTSAQGTHVLRMRWGRVTEVRIYTDTTVLQRTLERLARSGVAEASSDPIVDADSPAS